MTETPTQPPVRRRTAAYRRTTSLWDVSARLQENFRRVEAILENIEHNDPDSETQIAAAAELRHHIALAQKTLETAIQAQAQREFENIVTTALDQADIRVRRKVLDVLHARARQIEQEQDPIGATSQ